MTEEKNLKKEGEDLAKIAVESKLGSKQLRTIYTLTKTKPLPFVEAFIQHQLSRVQGTKALEKALELLKSHGEDKAALERVFMYANMLYPYYEREAAMKYKIVAEEAARRICDQQGCKYVGLDVYTEKDRTEVSVRVSGYRGDPKLLASSIGREIVHRDPKFLGRVWIEQVDRR